MTTLKQLIHASLFTAQDSLQQIKQLLKQKDTELREKFDPQSSVSGLIKEKSDFIDLILTGCWQHFLGVHAHHLCLLAVGGYGRRELFPYSDI
ncbi:MAG: [protein-PII] uridylyltransferase, partial [Methylobacter sp.]|nr:[protein-PII] uridylyltransferase [Methylobacter sp.]